MYLAQLSSKRIQAPSSTSISMEHSSLSNLMAGLAARSCASGSRWTVVYQEACRRHTPGASTSIFVHECQDALRFTVHIRGCELLCILYVCTPCVVFIEFSGLHFSYESSLSGSASYRLQFKLKRSESLQTVERLRHTYWLRCRLQLNVLNC